MTKSTYDIALGLSIDYPSYKEISLYSHCELNLKFPTCVINSVWFGITTIDLSEHFLHLTLEGSGKGHNSNTFYCSIPWNKLYCNRVSFLRRLTLGGFSLVTHDNKFCINVTLPKIMEQFVKAKLTNLPVPSKKGSPL